MKKAILWLLLAAGIPQAWGQEQPELAPLNPDYKKYMNQLKKSAQPEQYPRGYVPAPFRVNFKNYAQRPLLKASQQLPERYDLREEGYVTPVKDQGTFGTCWAFAAIGSVESRWRRLEGTIQDLSEKNMVTCSGFELMPDDGGNIYLATAYLSRLDGPIAEADDPYENLTASSLCTVDEPPLAYIPEARFLPPDNDEVKRAILHYGAVSTSMYAGESDQYYSPMNYTWYYNGTENTDHGILIVGWDDNKVVTGGPQSPNTTGAWIIKNSWGAGFGENGYFYLAYEDTKVLTSSGFYPRKWEKTRIDSLHQYDKLGMVTSLGYRNEVMYGLTRFELEEGESIQKVGTWINTYGSEIEITVFDSFDSNALQPVDPVDTLRKQWVYYPGYHTFDITPQATGDVYVQIRYRTPNNGYPLPVETTISGYAVADIEPSGTHWYSRDGQNWVASGSDTENSPYDLCIRAYTRKSSPLASFETERNYYCIDETVTFTNQSQGQISSYQWNFGEGASPATATGPGPHQVSYTTPGGKSVSLRVEGSAGKDSVLEKDYITIAEELHIFFSNDQRESSMGDTIQLRVNGQAETYEWEGEGLVSSSGPEALVTYQGEEEKNLTIRVTGNTGTCSDSDSIRVYFTLGPSNDDVCNAMELSAGMNENLTNQYASVQANEPLPDTTGADACTAPMKWCNEGGLQHTVWYTIVLPQEGDLSIVTSGMDTQIALYEAAECGDILTGNYTLLAANDDYFGEDQDYAAAIMDVSGLNPGQTYYLQLDGSAGGVEGTYSIELTGSAVGIGDKPSGSHQGFEVFPNPSQGNFSIKLDPSLELPVSLRLTALDGRTLLSKQLRTINPGSVYQLQAPANIQAGIYLLSITSPSQTFIQKVVIH
jgi:C1A family cysteine protease/PKD repeat protein